MTKKKREGLTDGEFEALVDAGFKSPKPRKSKGGPAPWKPPDELITKLEREGFDPRLSKSGMRFHAAVCRVLGVSPKPLSDDSAAFINALDKTMKSVASANGIECRDDDEDE